MKLNKDKTKIIQFNKTTQVLSSLQTSFGNLLTINLPYLGYCISKNLLWTDHINNTIKKLASQIHILRVLKSTLSKKYLLQVYAAYFQSRLDSLFPILQSLTKKDLSKLNAIVKRAHWIICGQDARIVAYHTIQSDAIINIADHLFYAITTNKSHILHDLLPQKSIRTNRFILPHITNNSYLNSFIIQGAISYNQKCDNR